MQSSKHETNRSSNTFKKYDAPKYSIENFRQKQFFEHNMNELQ